MPCTVYGDSVFGSFDVASRMLPNIYASFSMPASKASDLVGYDLKNGEARAISRQGETGTFLFTAYCFEKKIMYNLSTGFTITALQPPPIPRVAQRLSSHRLS